MIVIRYVFVWFGLVFIAMLNGGLRNEVYGKYVTELNAHQISTGIGLTIFTLYLWLVSHFWKIPTRRDALIICCLWFTMTILFEFVFGHFVMGNSWSKLLHDYNLFEGRLWILVMIWTILAPYISYRLSR